MRHFAKELTQKGYQLHYVKLTDKNNTQSIADEVGRALKKYDAKEIVATSPGEYRVLESMKSWSKELDTPADIRDDDRFICSLDDFKAWATDRKQLRMEYFYRELRKKNKHSNA
jgi:deoxyribodipyrimidine photolyase-related protein